MFKHSPPPFDDELEDNPERSQSDYPCFPPNPNVPFQGHPNHGPCHHDPHYHNAPPPPRPPGHPGPFRQDPPHGDEDEGPDFPPPFPPRGMFGGLLLYHPSKESQRYIHSRGGEQNQRLPLCQKRKPMRV